MFLEFTDVLLVDLWAALPFPASGRPKGSPETCRGRRPAEIFSDDAARNKGQTEICPELHLTAPLGAEQNRITKLQV
jgi:hypothetical protein